MKASEVYVDPSALTKLYIHQPGSRSISSWRARIDGELIVTHHGRVEIINAISRAVFIGEFDLNAARAALAHLHTDFAEGRLHQAEILWRAALNRAAELSQRYSPTLGTRALDVLHVACALELRTRRFLTFDRNQRLLADAVGLKSVNLPN